MEKIIQFITLISASGLLGLWFGRKKQKAEIDSVILKNAETAIGMYEKIIQEQDKRYEDLLKKHNDLINELETYMDELKSLRKEIAEKDALLSMHQQTPLQPIQATVRRTRSR